MDYRAVSNSRINFNEGFKVNIPITNLKAIDDSLAQPSKATNFSTNVSQEGNTHRLPKLPKQAKATHFRVNSLLGEGKAK